MITKVIPTAITPGTAARLAMVCKLSKVAKLGSAMPNTRQRRNKRRQRPPRAEAIDNRANDRGRRDRSSLQALRIDPSLVFDIAHGRPGKNGESYEPKCTLWLNIESPGFSVHVLASVSAAVCLATDAFQF